MKSSEANGHELRPINEKTDLEADYNKSPDDQKRFDCWKLCRRNRPPPAPEVENGMENHASTNNCDKNVTNNCKNSENSSKENDTSKKKDNPTITDIKLMTAKEKASLFCKKFTAFVFSTIGTTVVMVSYTILGGLIFNQLEAPYEEETKAGVQHALRQRVLELWNITETLNVLHPIEWNMRATWVLGNYTKEIFMATKVEGWDGKYVTEAEQAAAQDLGEYQLQWGFAGALLYSITVVTTIGYGHIAPKTIWGKVITMLYALIGIPLTLLAITNIGRAMAMAFRFLYRNVLTVLCCLFCRPACVRVLISPPLHPEEEDEYEVAMTKDDENPDGVRTVGVRMVPNWRRNLRLLTYDMKVIEQVNVPIPITVLLIAGYIGLGSLLFGIWEGWDTVESAYFCFVTLSTIGFGDYVPGTDLEKPGATSKLVLCALYLFIGLAYLAMCFDLMQEGVKVIFRQLGRKLGLISSND